MNNPAQTRSALLRRSSCSNGVLYTKILIQNLKRHISQNQSVLVFFCHPQTNPDVHRSRPYIKLNTPQELCTHTVISPHQVQSVEASGTHLKSEEGCVTYQVSLSFIHLAPEWAGSALNWIPLEPLAFGNLNGRLLLRGRLHAQYSHV